MAISLAIKTPPVAEPVSLDEMKLHLRVDFNEDDSLIATMMKAARGKLEGQFYVSAMTQSLVLTLDRFVQPGTPVPSYGYPMVATYGLGPWGVSPWGDMQPSWSAIDLRPPLQSVTAITYIDPTGTLKTLASSNYTTAPGIPGRVFPAVNKIWPVTGMLPGAASIEFVSGYTTADLVPDEFKASIKLTVASLYQNREQTVIGSRLIAVTLPDGVQDLMGGWMPMLVR